MMTKAAIRKLCADDAGLLERFLEVHRDSSMFLRANARGAGLEYAGKLEQATYFAEVMGDEVVGVAAHCWNGMLLVQAPAPARVEALARECVQSSSRKVTGFSGPLEHVRRARAALDLGGAPSLDDEAEGLYALQLADLVVPSALSDGSVPCRSPLASEHDILKEWRFAYDVETLGAEPSESTRARATGFLEMQLARGDARVAVADGKPASFAAFNASLPDIVQLGGIYTPPELRSRGYARAAIAALLLDARARGASRSVLFTNGASAIRCYASLGFRQVGEYGLVLLA
jgi:predicted GNAT family acetyltransferase